MLADWLRRATDQLAERTGSTIGGLLNISFGNTAELLEVVGDLVQVTIGRKVGPTDRVQCPLGSRGNWSGRYKPYPSDQSTDLDQVRDSRPSGEPTPSGEVTESKGTNFLNLNIGGSAL